MRRARLINSLLVIPALLLGVVEACVLRPAGALLDALHRVPAMQRLHLRLTRLPPGAALPLFLIPEAASRAGWIASAWLLVSGAGWEALLVYVITKVFAGLTALWVYRACEPALLRVRWFARLHEAGRRMRGAIKPHRPDATPRYRTRLGTLP